MGESQGVRNFGGGFDFTFGFRGFNTFYLWEKARESELGGGFYSTYGKMGLSALLELLVRQEAWEEGVEHLFAKLRALVCRVCATSSSSSLFSLWGLPVAMCTSMREMVAKPSLGLYLCSFCTYLFVICCLSGLTKPYIISRFCGFLDFSSASRLVLGSAFSWVRYYRILI